MPIRWLMTNVPQKTCVTSANWTICLILLGISFAASAAPVLPWSDEGIMAELSRRALLMDDAIHATMLVDGLVTNKLHGEPDDVCDSLLWSSIRAASLYNMGQLDRYNEAVIALRRSTVGPGQWRRHPRCGKTLSRDMIDGLLVLAATDPVGNAATLHATALYIQSNWGFIASSISPVWAAASARLRVSTARAFVCSVGSASSEPRSRSLAWAGWCSSSRLVPV